MRVRLATALLLLAAASCTDDPPDGIAMAGAVTLANAAEVLLQGPHAYGAPGDVYLRNDQVTAIIERPRRAFGLSPYGGNLIDFGSTATRVDDLGEVIFFADLGRTPDFDTLTVVDDGAESGEAVVVAEGEDALWDTLNLQTLNPLLRHDTGILSFDPGAPLPVRWTTEYRLARDARHLELRTTLESLHDRPLEARVGFGVDMRGTVESFAPGRGFTEPGLDVNDIAALLSARIDSPYLAYQGEGRAIGLRSVDFLDGVPTPRLSVAVVGIALVIPGIATLGELLEPRAPFRLEPGETRGYGFDLALGSDVGDLREWAEGTDDWVTLAGTVTDGAPVAGARVAVLDPANGDVVGAFVTGADGRFGGRVPPGTYRVAADELAHPADPGREVTAPASDVTIELGRPARVSVNVQSANHIDDPTLEASPCRVVLIGEGPVRNGGLDCCEDHRPFRKDKLWELSPPVPYAAHLLQCNAALDVVPGEYLAVVTRGPEFDLVQAMLQLEPGGEASVTGTLHRAVDSSGYVACDFHVHQVPSTDSLVPLDLRVTSFVSAALDFIATSDHDTAFDLRPVVTALGVDDQLVLVPGEEVSTMDLGHYNGFPIEPRPGTNDGGPVDWAGGEQRPLPGQLFEHIRARGARVVQLNHPRMNGSYFTALDPIYDLVSGDIRANPAIAPPNALMRMAEGELWATNFDAVEIYNGIAHRTTPDTMRDWFNLLSLGITPTGTAVSDSHDSFIRNPGEPRTYVAVADDDPRTLVADDVIDAILAGRAVGSSGPILRVTASAGSASAGIGDLLTPAAGAVTMQVHVETPAWYAVDTLELYVTQTYVDAAGSSQTIPLAPTLTQPLATTEVTYTNGGRGLTADATVILDDLGPTDGWVVIRVSGAGTLLPLALSRGDPVLHPEGTTPETFVTYAGGVEPFAFANPIFLDRDGNGAYDAPYPR